MTHRARWLPLALLAGWALVVAAVGLGPNVPLDDSWNYAAMTQRLLDHGTLRFSPYDSAMVVLHLLWGALVTAVLGFSFVTCRLANLLAAAFAILAVYWMARETRATPGRAALLAAATAVAPPFFVLAFTYMADFWYLIPAWLSLGFMLRYARTRQVEPLVFASLAVALSFWNRAHGLALWAAYVLALLLYRRRLAPTASGWLALLGIPGVSWMLLVFARPELHPVRTTLARKSDEILARLTHPAVLLADGLDRAAITWLSLGLFALPILIALAAPALRRRRLPLALPGAILALAAAAWLVVGKHDLYPFASSVLREQPALTAPWVLIPLTVAAALGAAWLAFRLVAAPADRRDDAVVPLLILAALSQLAPLLLLDYFMDRYFLFAIPVLMLLIPAAVPTRPAAWRPALAALLVLVMILIGAARVHEFRNGVAAQWRAADRLLAAGHDPATIDGGYGWFGWHNYPACLDRVATHAAPDPRHTHYVVELCPESPIAYDVVFIELPPPWEPIDTEAYADPFGAPGLVRVYRRPPLK